MSKSVGSASFELNRYPWFAVACWWGMGLLFVFLATRIPRYELVMRYGFTFAGAGTVVGGLFLPKTRIRLDERTQTLEWRSGPWIGLWGKGRSLPVNSIVAVCYYRTVTPGAKSGFQQHFNLSVITKESASIPLFPLTHAPLNTPKVGKALAERLGVEYRENL